MFRSYRYRASPAERERLDALRADRAGCVLLSYSRRTGALRGIYRADEAGIDSDSPWAVVCERHHTICTVDTKRHALRTDTDDFCDECRERPYAALVAP